MQRRIAQALHDILLSVPGMTDKVRYKVPFYYRRTWICYLSPQKNGAIELCFVRANELSDAGGLLDFKERTQVAGLTIAQVADIPEDGLWELIQEAVLLDESTKRKK